MGIENLEFLEDANISHKAAYVHRQWRHRMWSSVKEGTYKSRVLERLMREIREIAWREYAGKKCDRRWRGRSIGNV